MVISGLRLTALFVILWMLPASLAVLLMLTARRPRSPTARTSRSALRGLILAYLLAAVALNLWPLDFDFSIVRMFRHGNFIPLQGSLRFLISHASERAYLRHDFLHVVLLIPVGVLLPLQLRRRQRLWAIAASAVAVVLLAFGMEVAQGLTVVRRAFDVDDAIGGGAGGLAAVVVGAVMRFAVTTSPRRAASGPAHP